MKKSDITKQKILEAAEAEFSESGLYGARVESISERAGVNKRMIYAYFVNKEQLYITVLTGVYNRMAQEEKKLLGCRLSCEDMIRRIIAMYFDFLYHNPTFVRMLMWENLNNASYIKSSEAGIVKGYSLKMLSDTIARGIYEGVFRPDIDLESIVLSINMFCFSYFSNIHTMSYLMQKDLESETAVRRYAGYVTEMILKFLLRMPK